MMGDKGNERTLSLSFPVVQGDFIQAGEASSKIKKVLTQLGFPTSIVRRVAIAAYEAEMNMVIHSQGGEIRVQISSENIHITAQDRGPGIPDISLAMQEGYSTAPDNIRELGFGAGMGLPNMRNCSTEFSINSEIGKGTIVEMVIALKE